ncbi:MAG: DUF4625 domain-containing protein [Prevotella sp.]|nr:DUF4625 domain-containing protein [Prevotella sp.]
MKNFCLILIILIIVPAAWFSSCSGSDDYNDNEKPVISNVRFNSNDTIIYNNETITINDSLNTEANRIDTLVIGKIVYLTARFQDNLALSGYKVALDSVLENRGNGKDSAYTFYALGANIFGEKRDVKDTIIRRNNLLTIPNFFLRAKTNETVPIREGEYSMKVVCGDKYGGENSRDSVISKVMLFSRETIYNIRKK